LLIDDQRLCLQVFDTTQWRGRLSLDERAVHQWHDEIDALLQRCEAAFPVRTPRALGNALGLAIIVG
jgi:hypothetical protein